MSASQAESCEFEPRRPLQIITTPRSLLKPKKPLVHIATLLVGIVIGLGFALSVKRSDIEVEHGFPLPWAVWQKVDDRWLDFVSPLSPFLFGFDLLVGIGLAYAASALLHLLWRFRKKVTNTK